MKRYKYYDVQYIADKTKSSIRNFLRIQQVMINIMLEILTYFIPVQKTLHTIFSQEMNQRTLNLDIL